MGAFELLHKFHRKDNHVWLKCGDNTIASEFLADQYDIAMLRKWLEEKIEVHRPNCPLNNEE